MKQSHEWLEGILNDPNFRARVDTVVVAADTYLATQLARNLMQLRNQQRTNAYKQIFAARTKVSEDLLALQNSLSALIHYSAVAGEDANVFIALQRSVVTVTQKLSIFGEEDADGDGMRDSQAKAPGTPADPAAAGNPEKNLPSLDMEIDRAPIAPDNQPEPKEVLPANKVQQDPDDVTDEDAVPPAGPAADGQEEDAPEPGAAEPNKGAAPEKPAPEGFDTEVDEGAPEGDAPAGDAPEDEEDEDSDAKAPEQEEVVEDKDKLHQEFGRLAQKGKKAKKGLFESLTDPDLDKKEPAEGEAAASVAEAKQDVKKEKNFRFVYRGIRGNCVSALITNKVYYFQPTEKLYKGDVNKVDVALRKHLETHPGYTNALATLNQLRTAGKLKIIRRVSLSKQQLRKILHAPEQNAHTQLGTIKFDEGTAWRYRGVGLQKISNQEAALWLEVGDTEYAVLPNKKVFGNKDIEDVNGSIQQKLKLLSYTDGLKYLVRLVHNKQLQVIYQGKIVA